MTVTPDTTIFDQGKQILDWLRGCLGAECRERAYVGMGRPLVVADSMIVWRSNGPYQENANPAAPLMAIDWSVTIATCCHPVEVEHPANPGWMVVPSPEQYETAALRHETQIGTIAGLIAMKSRHIFGPSVKLSTVGTDPDAQVADGCFTDTIRIAGVPWRPVPCGDC